MYRYVFLGGSEMCLIDKKLGVKAVISWLAVVGGVGNSIY